MRRGLSIFSVRRSLVFYLRGIVCVLVGCCRIGIGFRRRRRCRVLGREAKKSC